MEILTTNILPVLEEMAPPTTGLKPLSLAQTFTYFPELPSELQIKIWKIAVAHIKPRIITFMLPVDGSSRHQNQRRRRKRCSSRYTTNAIIPGTLWACHNSRIEALNIFTLSFGKSLGHPIYFNYNRDIFMMADVAAFIGLLKVTDGADNRASQDLSRVRTIAFKGFLNRGDMLSLLQIIRDFGGIEEIMAPDPVEVEGLEGLSGNVMNFANVAPLDKVRVWEIDRMFSYRTSHGRPDPPDIFGTMPKITACALEELARENRE